MSQIDLSSFVAKLDSAVWAAILAAVTSLLSLLSTIVSSKNSERRSAFRQTFQTSLNETGALLYRIVAASQKMTEMKRDETFNAARDVADKSCRRLDQLSRELRYALWGIDEGFRTMRMIPSYIGNLKNDRKGERANRIIALSTELREALDNSVRKAYLKGKPPGLFHKIIVGRSYRRLRTFSKSCKPSSAQRLALHNSHRSHRQDDRS